MSEFLTVRLSNQTKNSIPWLVWSTAQNEVIASGELEGVEQLQSLLPYAEKRSVIALLDTQDINLKCVDIPAGGARQLNNLLPFMFEDDVAQDIDELHLSVMYKTSSNAWVAAIDKSLLQGWISRFKDHGIEINRVIPDVLALPESDHSASTVQMGNQWLLRKGKHLGMVVHHSVFPFMLQSPWLVADSTLITDTEKAEQAEDSEDSEGDDVDSSPAKSIITAFSKNETLELPANIDWDEQPVEMPMALLAQGAVASNINLLSGALKKKSTAFKEWRVWRPVAVLAVILTGLMFGSSYFDTLQKEQQAAQYRAASEDTFRTIFPNKRKIPTVSYLKRQMNDEMSRLSGGETEGIDLLPWLAKLPQALADLDKLKVTSIKFDSTREELKIKASGDDFQVFEQARIQMEQNFSVVQGQLNRSGGKVLGDFTLTQRVGGTE